MNGEDAQFLREAQKHLENWAEMHSDKGEIYFKTEYEENAEARSLIIEKTLEPDGEETPDEKTSVSKYWGFQTASGKEVSEWTEEQVEIYGDLVDQSRSGYGGIDLQ